MKTSYRQNNRARLWLVVATVFVALVIAVDLLAGGAVRSLVRGSVATVWVGANRVSDSIHESGTLRSKESLAEENTRLSAELSALQYLEMENRLLRAENTSLRSLVNLPNQEESVAARILSAPGASPYDSIVIGAGSADGVAVGDYVVMGNGVAIGFVSEVGSRTALVGLYLAAGRETPAIVGGTAAVTVLGRGGSNGSVTVPRSVPVAAGDLVYLSGTSYALGVVGSVEATATDARSRVYLALPTSIAETRFVQVVPALPLEVNAPNDL